MSAELTPPRRAARAVAAVERARGWRPGARRGFPWRKAGIPAGVVVPARPSRTGAAFDTAWARTDTARGVRAALIEGPMRLGVGALARPQVRGRDRLADLEAADPVRPVIFAANHHSHLDTPIVLTSLPGAWRHRTVVAAAADYFFDKRLTVAASALVLGAIPIERTRVNRRSADLAGELLDDGWSLLIFPEGGRSPDGWGQTFRGGAAFLAVRSEAPVIPIHIEGTGAILGKGMNQPRLGGTVVTFGRPMRPEPDEDARRFGVRIEEAVAALGDEEATDWYSARRRAAAGETPSLSGPETTSWRRAWDRGDRRQGVRRGPHRPTWPDLG